MRSLTRESQSARPLAMASGATDAGGTTAPGVSVRVDSRQLKLLATKRRISGKQLVSAGTLFEHARNFVDPYSRSPNTGLATPDLRIFDDHLAGTLKERQFRADLVEDAFHVEREPTVKETKGSGPRPCPATVGNDRFVESIFAFRCELEESRIQPVRDNQIKEVIFFERSFASGFLSCRL